MVLGKRWLFLIGNGAEIRPLEMGTKGPAEDRFCRFEAQIVWSSQV